MELFGGAECWVGRVLGDRYKLGPILGRGAQSVVYQAQPLNMERRLAIKVLDLTLMGSDEADWFRRRMTQEAEILAQLHDPHIVSIVDILEPRSGCLCLVMQHVNGETLRQVVRREGGLPMVQVWDLFRQLLASVAAAHRAGVVHRDLKPDNIMIERLALGERFVRLLDFGVASVQGLATGSASRFMGTPAYASPEQILTEHIDHRSDIYTLGVVLFFMLTGRLPFQGHTAFALFDQHLHDPIPSLRGEADLTPVQITYLDALIEDMTRKDPDARPQDLNDVLHRMESGWRMLASGVKATVQAVLWSTPARQPHVVEALSQEPTCQVINVVDADQMYERIRRGDGGLFVLDMSVTCGVDMCRFIRMRTDAPIVVLANLDVESEADDALHALHVGADVLVSWPPKLGTFSVQLRAVVRRASRSALSTSNEWVSVRTTGEWQTLWHRMDSDVRVGLEEHSSEGASSPQASGWCFTSQHTLTGEESSEC